MSQETNGTHVALSPEAAELLRKGKLALEVRRRAEEDRERLVAYLGTDCPHCHQWVRVLNLVHRSPALPDVVGVVGAPAEARRAFVEEHGVRFPVVSIRRARMDRLASAVPTTVLVERGVIERQVAILAPRAVGAGLTALVEVTLDRQGAEHLDAFEALAVADAAVQQVYRVSPGPDFVLVVHAADMAGYHALAQRLFTQNANVRNVKAFFSVKRAKFDPRVPLTPSAVLRGP